MKQIIITVLLLVAMPICKAQSKPNDLLAEARKAIEASNAIYSYPLHPQMHVFCHPTLRMYAEVRTLRSSLKMNGR